MKYVSIEYLFSRFDWNGYDREFILIHKLRFNQNEKEIEMKGNRYRINECH